MKKLSTGHDSTLTNWKALAIFVFGKDSWSVNYLDEQIAKRGDQEEVPADERQVLHLLMTIHGEGLKANANEQSEIAA